MDPVDILDKVNSKVSPKILIVIVILGIVLFNSFIIVQTGNSKVQLTFGKMHDKPVPEGLHLVNPISNFIPFDLKDQTLTWEKIEIPAQDKLKSTMDVSVTYRLKAGQEPFIYQNSGTMRQLIQKHITPKVRSILRESGKSVAKSQDFFSDKIQNQMERFVLTGLREYLEPKGVEIIAVLFRDISLPRVVTTAVIDTKKRQELVNQEQAQLEIVELVAQKEVKEANARRDAAVSDGQAKRTLADARAYEIEQIATAQAKANKMVAASLSDRLISYTKIEKWNGTVPTTVMGDGQGVFVSLPAK